MKLGIRIAAIATFSVLLVSQAAAQWIHQAEEDAFSGSTQHLALSASKGYALGFRCSDEEELTLVFMTPESTDGDSVESVNFVGTNILFRVDQGEVITLESEAVASKADTLILLSRNEDVMLAALESVKAGQRIAVAVEAAGERFHSSTFSVSGSTTAINKVLVGCDLL